MPSIESRQSECVSECVIGHLSAVADNVLFDPVNCQMSN